MRKRRVSATEAARNFSDIVGQVRYQATSFEILKGKEVVAQLVPARTASPCTLQEQILKLAGGAHLAAEDVGAYAADVATSRHQLTLGESEWG
jgi:antitoxin (DNA-binding transcriptional repressor) of toxin-antitoxin stability system